MNVIQGSQAQNIEKPIPGCLGRMVNLFDLSNGATGNRLLTDKPHGHGDFLVYIFIIYFLGKKCFGLFRHYV